MMETLVVKGLILSKIPMFFISTVIKNEITMKRWVEFSLYLTSFLFYKVMGMTSA